MLDMVLVNEQIKVEIFGSKQYMFLLMFQGVIFKEI